MNGVAEIDTKRGVTFSQSCCLDDGCIQNSATRWRTVWDPAPGQSGYPAGIVCTSHYTLTTLWNADNILFKFYWSFSSILP